MEDKFVMQYVDSPNFVTAVATGASLSGPSGDGMVHLHFFRDMMRPTQETFTRRALPHEDGKPQRFELTSAGEQSVELQRETVAVISVPINMASQLADILNKAATRTGS